MRIFKIILVLQFVFASLGLCAQNNVARDIDNNMIIMPRWYDYAKKGECNFLFPNPVISRPNGCGDPNYMPVVGYAFSEDSVTPSGEYFYECDKEGVLKKAKMVRYSNSDSIVICYNGTYTKPFTDILDTATQYVLGADGYYPESRYYYNYHLSGNEGGEDCFYDVISQIWNPSNNSWQSFLKETWSFANPVSGHISSCVTKVADAQGNLTVIVETASMKDSLVYDEAGNVKWRIMYRANNNDFVENGDRYEYFYHEDGGPYYEVIYYYSDQIGEQWSPKMRSIRTNIAWYEWNGFQDNFSYVFPISESQAGIYYHNTMSKMTAYDYYVDSWWSSGELGQVCTNKIDWNVDGTKTHIDSIFSYLEDGSFYFSGSVHDNYNECGDYTAHINCNRFWEDETKRYETSCSGTIYHIEYNQYGQEKNFCYLYTSEAADPFVFFGGTRIEDFAPVSIPILPPTSKKLSVFPNPASDNVQIKSEEMIRYVEIFDLTGKMVAFQPVFGSNTLLDVKRFAVGVYLIKATMKEGNIQTEKLIIQ